MRSEIQGSVVNSTVRVGDLEAQGSGFLIGERFIVTNAHCLPCLPDPVGQYVEPVLVRLQSVNNPELKAVGTVLFADPCADLAILASPDHEEMPTEAGQFEALVESLTGLPVCTKPLKRLFTVGVYLRNLDGTWLPGKAFVSGGEAMDLAVTLDDAHARVMDGTSGSPVVNAQGEVVGVNKIGSRTSPEYSAASLLSSLPGWMLRTLGAWK